jgi:transmembrane sensor
MNSRQFENTLIKFLNQQASAQEIDQLEKWLADQQNEDIFRGYIKINYLIDLNTQHFDKSKLLDELALLINHSAKPRKQFKIKYLVRYAAIFIALAFTFFGYRYFATKNVSEGPIKEVILQNEKGAVEILAQTGQSTIKNNKGIVIGDKHENSIVYKENSDVKKLIYNTLIVPYGRDFMLELSDGTQIHLNAGTSIRYPVNFIEGENRKVYIEYGEAYFDVAEDSDHPFIVSNDNLEIKVLGTEFNISAYPEDTEVSTVLIEGSVELSMETEDHHKEIELLKPGHIAVWSDKEQGFQTNPADIEMYTAWRTGKIILKSMAFGQMLEKLQRHYDVNIDCKDERLNDEIITATFDNESIEEVLELINEVHPISFKINGRDIEINNKKMP